MQRRSNGPEPEHSSFYQRFKHYTLTKNLWYGQSNIQYLQASFCSTPSSYRSRELLIAGGLEIQFTLPSIAYWYCCTSVKPEKASCEASLFWYHSRCNTGPLADTFMCSMVFGGYRINVWLRSKLWALIVFTCYYTLQVTVMHCHTRDRAVQQWRASGNAVNFSSVFIC